ncbi:MAG: universal stress protein [Candidatus Binatia bacterium]
MKILLAIDGSPCSEAAVREVATRQWPEGSEVKILAVVTVLLPDVPLDPFFVTYAAHMEMMKKERTRLEELVERTASELRKSVVSKELHIETAVIDGSPKQIIVEQAEQWNADLIILGCHGFGPVKRFLLGSVSQAVAVHAPCSVEIVRLRHAPEGQPV